MTQKKTRIALGTVVAGLLLAGSAHAGDAAMRNVGERARAAIDGYGYGYQSNISNEFIAVYCVDGYKFLLAGNRRDFQNAALLQMREIRGDKEVLATCQND